MSRELIKAFTALWLFGMYVLLVVTFMAAYQSPEKAVMVTINRAGEAEVEFLMLLGSLFLATIGTLYIMTDVKRGFLERAVGGPARQA